MISPHAISRDFHHKSVQEFCDTLISRNFSTIPKKFVNTPIDEFFHTVCDTLVSRIFWTLLQKDWRHFLSHQIHTAVISRIFPSFANFDALQNFMPEFFVCRFLKMTRTDSIWQNMNQAHSRDADRKNLCISKYGCCFVSKSNIYGCYFQASAQQSASLHSNKVKLFFGFLFQLHKSF